MLNIQPNYTYNIIDKIQKLVDDITTKILEYNGLSIDYVKAHPDKFSIQLIPEFGPSDTTIKYVVMHEGTVLGNYAIHSCFDIDGMRVTYSVDYTLGGDS